MNTPIILALDMRNLGNWTWWENHKYTPYPQFHMIGNNAPVITMDLLYWSTHSQYNCILNSNPDTLAEEMAYSPFWVISQEEGFLELFDRFMPLLTFFRVVRGGGYNPQYWYMPLEKSRIKKAAGRSRGFLWEFLHYSYMDASSVKSWTVGSNMTLMYIEKWTKRVNPHLDYNLLYFNLNHLNSLKR